MSISDQAKQYHEKMFPNYQSKLLKSDPEFIEIFDNFAFDEVISYGDIDDHTRFLVILAVLLGCQGLDEFQSMLKAAYHMGVTAVEMKEIVYQATAYLGIGRTFPFLKAVNDFCHEQGVDLPLPCQSTTQTHERLEKGRQAQVQILGENMKDFYQSGGKIAHIHYWLTDHCFGDYYTRKGLDAKQRELMTFCFLFSQGGCEEQLKAHIQANINIGHDNDFLIQIVSQCVPYIGFPRCLNALNCLKDVQENTL